MRKVSNEYQRRDSNKRLLAEDFSHQPKQYSGYRKDPQLLAQSEVQPPGASMISSQMAPQSNHDNRQSILGKYQQMIVEKRSDDEFGSSDDSHSSKLGGYQNQTDFKRYLESIFS
jgi:hypothetical protein